MSQEFSKFEALTRKVLKMSHEQLKAKLDAEKKAKAERKAAKEKRENG